LLVIDRIIGKFREIACIYRVANRGKRSVVVDVGSEEGVAIIKRLVETADVFVQNMRPGVGHFVAFRRFLVTFATISLFSF